MRQRADHQKGFTFLELLMVIAIMGALAPVVSLSIIQVIRGTDRNNTMVLALADIEHAASFINQDLQMALTTNLVNGASPINLVVGGSVTANWTDYYGGNATAHYSQYYVSVNSTRLMRNYDGQVANIALYLSRAEFSIDLSGKVFTVTLTSFPKTVLGRSQTKTYRIYRRSE